MKLSTYKMLRGILGLAIIAWTALMVVAVTTHSDSIAAQLFNAGLVVAGTAFMWHAWRRHRVFFFAIVAAAVLSLIAPAHAFAQEQATTMPLGDWINPQAGGGANNLICATLGDPGGLGLFGCQGQTTILWAIIKVFNMLALAFGVLYFSWNTISLTVSGANDGEFLGKRSSNAWVPIRTVMGASLLVPAFSGWNLAQLAMAWATAVGIGAANIAASTVAPAFGWGSIYASPITPSASSLRLELTSAMNCVADLTRYGKDISDAQAADPDTVAQYPVTPFAVATTSTPASVSVAIGGAAGNAAGYTPDQCGWVRQTLPAIASGSDTASAGIALALRAAVLAALPPLANVYVTTGTAIGNGTMSKEDAQARIAEAEAAYNSTLKTANTAAVTTANAAIGAAQIRFGDWTALGFQNLFATKAAVDLAQTTTVQTSSGFAGQRASTTEGRTGGESWVDVIRHPVTHLESTLSERANDLGQYVAELIGSYAGQSPLTALQHLGVNLITWVGAMLAFALIFPALVAAMAGPVLAAAGAVPLVGGAAETVATLVGSAINSTMNVFILILSIVGIPLIYFGFKAAAILPFMIAVAWVGAVFGWMAVVFEAMFGAPLWAIVHLDTDGEGLAQRANHGYLFILNLVFRPVILVGALALAQLSMTAIFGLFGTSLGAMVAAMTTDAGQWFTKLLMIVGAVIVAVTFAEQVVSMSLSLLYEIPNRVFAFIGGQFGADLGVAANGKLNPQLPGEAVATQGAMRGAGAHNRDLSREVDRTSGKMGGAQENADAIRKRFGLKRGGKTLGSGNISAGAKASPKSPV